MSYARVVQYIVSVAAAHDINCSVYIVQYTHPIYAYVLYESLVFPFSIICNKAYALESLFGCYFESLPAFPEICFCWNLLECKRFIEYRYFNYSTFLKHYCTVFCESTRVGNNSSHSTDSEMRRTDVTGDWN